METSNAPFSGLTPDFIFNALDSVGVFSDGRLLALNSYENRVYQVGMEQGPPNIVKFYRPARWSDVAILEEHTFVQSLVEAELPVIPAIMLNGSTLHTFEGFRFAVFPKQGGRAPELEDPATLEWMGRFIGRIHAIGAISQFSTRPTLDIASFGEEPRDYLLQNGFIPIELQSPWLSVINQALEGVQRCFDQAGEFAVLRLHQLRQMADLLAGYEDFYDFNPRELHLVEALRTLRLIHYSAWLARRWHDPAFPVAFPWFNTQHYWQNRILELREQIALMDEPPLWQGL